MKPATEIIALAEQKTQTPVSADLLEMAKGFLNVDQEYSARFIALRALLHTVGPAHPDYVKAVLE